MIRVSIPDLNDVLRRLPDEAKARKAMMRAINRTVTTSKSAASKKVREEYVLKAAKINEATRVIKASPSRLEAKIEWRSPMVNLANFRVNPKVRPRKPLKRQLVAEVKRGKKVTYRGAFIGPNARVFRRTSKKRLPITPVYGPSVSHLMGADKVKTEIQNKARETLVTRVNHEVNRMLGP